MTEDSNFNGFAVLDPEASVETQDLVAPSGKDEAADLMRPPAKEFDFQISAQGSNALLELAMPLLGLASRMRTLSQYDDVVGLHNRLQNEIDAFFRALEAKEYDPATCMAARYTICAVIDESLMSQQWGAESSWSERPLLSVFHNETWGGEKIFAIIDRVLDEPHRFLHLLEFLYYCLALGFEGKYHVMHNGRTKLDALMGTMHDVLVKHMGEAPIEIVNPAPNILDTREKMRVRFPIWGLLVIALGTMVAVHTYFSQNLETRITEIGDEIKGVLQSDFGDGS